MSIGQSQVPVVLFDSDRMRGQIITPEADCACPLSHSPNDFAAATESVHSDQILCQMPSSRFEMLAPLMVLNSPYSRAGIAVLNSTADQIWQQFSEPRSVAAALDGLGDGEAGPAQQNAVSLLYSCGLLRDSKSVDIPFAKADTLIAWLHVTNACNLRCDYCYLAKTNEMMSESTGRRSLETVFRSARLHSFQKVKIKYAGGEATLNFDLVDRLHGQARQLADQLRVAVQGVILSNGVRLSSEMIGTMLRQHLRLMISLDGLEAEHDAQRSFRNGRGSFKMVARNIEMAVDNGLIPDVCVTVTSRSAAGLAQLVGWLLERELPFTLNYYRENDISASFADLRLEEDKIIRGALAAFKIIESSLPRRSLLTSLVDRANLAAPHERPCAAGENYLVIDHKGRIAKCQMEIGKSLTDISAKDPLRIIRTDESSVQNHTVDEKEGCRECKWKYWCAGGCPYATFRATGRHDIKSPNCNIYKALFPEVIRLEALRLLRYKPRMDANERQ